ncbi:SDR family oxidoreductase [Agrobacterium arsenijevicii]|uniref:Oxidoreductase n=1 Tax=Agrobacterium arsenijevicii TaxID=1585697 RepID=A0ABR5D3P2_9HYPH|nr:oxidoreductase [Agrobacterium arsenijevicii]
MGRLNGKTCFVTGAAQGIGREVLDAFLREGAVVIASDINGDGLKALADIDGVTTIELDVTDPDAVQATAIRFPDISVLVNCAGYVATGTILECSSKQLDLSLQVNVKSMFNTISAFLPNMAQRRAGSIINIASVVSSIMAAPERFAYATSKAAVVGLTMSVARDFAALGVRCNAISPGTVETPSLHTRMEATGDAEEARKKFVSRQLMGRLGTAGEIAAIAVLMASEEATFMTGSNIVIDGGMSL